MNPTANSNFNILVKVITIFKILFFKISLNCTVYKGKGLKLKSSQEDDSVTETQKTKKSRKVKIKNKVISSVEIIYSLHCCCAST